MDANEKLAIHELLNRAAYGYDSRNIEMLSECFAEEAEMTMRIAGGDLVGPFKGNKEIMKLMTSSMEQQSDKRLHEISNIFFEKEDGEVATVLSSLTLIAVADGGIKLLTTGIYRDDVIKEDNSWKLKKRHLDLELSY